MKFEKRRQELEAKRKRGFTLIELLVVISIISLLSSVILASLSSARRKAKNTYAVSAIHEYVNALNLYYSNHGDYPDLAGSGYGGYSCLGEYDTNTGGCQGDGYNGNAFYAGFTQDFSDALHPYLKKLPNPSEGGDYTGGIYQYFGAGGYEFYTGSSLSATAMLAWVKPDSNGSCGPGTEFNYAGYNDACIVLLD